MPSASSLQKSGTLSGPAIVQAFLEELATFVRQCPDNTVTGTRQEIVEDVVRGSSRFVNRSDGCIDALRKQLPIAIGAHGDRHRLRYERLSNERVKITVV